MKARVLCCFWDSSALFDSASWRMNKILKVPTTPIFVTCVKHLQIILMLPALTLKGLSPSHLCYSVLLTSHISDRIVVNLFLFSICLVGVVWWVSLRDRVRVPSSIPVAHWGGSYKLSAQLVTWSGTGKIGLQTCCITSCIVTLGSWGCEIVRTELELNHYSQGGELWLGLVVW
jgi:hypothetical protein